MLGVDISKATLAYTHLDPLSQTVLRQGSIANTPGAITQLLSQLPSECSLTLEPTGRYGHTRVDLAHRSGRRVHLAQTRKARAFLQSLQDRAKTDRLDSYGLARFGLSRTLPLYPLKNDMHEHLDQLLSARKGLSQSLTSLNQQRKELHQAAPYLEAVTLSIREQIQALDKQIQQLTQAPQAPQAPVAPTNASHNDISKTEISNEMPLDKLVLELQKVPGIGLVTATTVASCLTRNRFAKAGSFVAYIGLDVLTHESGRKKGQHGLSRRGHAELRRLLYLAAQASLRAKNSPFKAQYEHERAKGLSSTAALCAVARKLARLCWSIATYNTPYDPARIYSQHPQHQEPKIPEPHCSQSFSLD